jgi:hypothetical protein
MSDICRTLATISGAPVVHLDSFTAGQTTGAPEIVAKVRQMSDMLRCEALPRGASQELIMKVAKERWQYELAQKQLQLR